MSMGKVLSIVGCVGSLLGAGCAAEMEELEDEQSALESDESSDEEAAGISQGLVGGVQRATVKSSTSPEPHKELIARCPAGTKVVGGGAFIDDGGQGKVRLTKLHPIQDNKGTGYVVRGESSEGFSGRWTLDAYALCGIAPSGWEVKLASASGARSPLFLHAAAVCSPGKKAIGVGAEVLDGYRNVGLQMMRASGPLDIVRSVAREANGFTGAWSLRSYAICADPMPGQKGEGVVVHDRGTYAQCPSGTQVHSVGGGAGPLSNNAPDVGPVWLQVVFPSSDKRGFMTYMTGAPTGGMVASAICAH